MTVLQQDQSKGLDLIVTDYEEKKDKYAAVPALVDVFEELIVIKTEIENCTKKQLLNTTGITETKAEVKNALGSSAYVVASGISAWAEKNNNSTVLAQVNFTELALQRINDKLMTPTCKNIYELAEANAVDILPFGVDADSMQQMATDMKTWVKILAAPRQQIIDKAAETKQIDVLLKKAFSLLKKQADKLVVKLKKTDLATYNSYMAVRPWPHASGSKKNVPPIPPAAN